MSRLATALVLVLAVSPGAWAATPTDALQQVFAQADRILRDPDTEERPLERLLAIRKLVNDAFDFRSAAELASGEHWQARTAAEQEEFTWLFADLLERSFVARMAAQANLAGGTRIKYLDESVEGDTARVLTAVGRKNGGELLLGYRLIEREGAWKIRDVAMDGVSIMANYRAQLDRVLGTASFPELLTQMRAMVGTPEPAATTASSADIVPSAAPASAEATPAVEVPLRAEATLTVEATPTGAASPLAEPGLSADMSLPLVTVADTSSGAPEVAAEDAPPLALTAAVTDVSPAAAAEDVSATDVSPAAPPVATAEVLPRVETAPTDEASLPAQPVSAEPLPPAPELRVAAIDPVHTSPPVEPPQTHTAPEVQMAAPSPRTLTTKAYWLKISTVELADAGPLVTRLRDGKHDVALERTSVSGKQMVQVSVGPFQDAAEAVFQLLDLQTKGHDPFLVAERE